MKYIKFILYYIIKRNGVTMAIKICNPMTVVEYKDLKFVIFDTPNEDNAKIYLQELQKHQVTHVVRVCQPTYNPEIFINHGMKFYDWPIKDGTVPSEQIINKLLQLIKNEKNPVIGIHCVSGLGRAPILVAIALIENGMQPLIAADYIRKRRSKCFNHNQVMFLSEYNSHRSKCIIS